MATLRAMPVLEVSDVAASAAFYGRLGFASHGFHGDPPLFCIVQRGDVTIALAGGTGPLRVNNGWCAYVYVSDAHALRDEFVAEGVMVTELGERPYGLQDFDIVDPDGHRIAFGSDLTPAPVGPGLGSDRGRG